MTKIDGRLRKTPRIFDKSNPPKVSLVGQKFGKLTIIDWAGKSDVNVSTKRRQIVNFWLCQCDCGNPDYSPVVVETRCLKSGNTASCGCTLRKHQMAGTPLYHVWGGMIGRCTNPNNDDYPRYGGRGITVCDLWRDFESFFSDMGEPPTRAHTLDRIDNSQGYKPGNCQWATRKEQNRNRRDNRYITWQNETKTLAEWGDAPSLKTLNITSSHIAKRLRSGWSLEKAMTTPSIVGKLITFRDETMTMIEWSKRLGSPNNIVSKRLRSGWTVEAALLTPPKV